MMHWYQIAPLYWEARYLIGAYTFIHSLFAALSSLLSIILFHLYYPHCVITVTQGTHTIIMWPISSGSRQTQKQSVHNPFSFWLTRCQLACDFWTSKINVFIDFFYPFLWSPFITPFFFSQKSSFTYFWRFTFFLLIFVFRFFVCFIFYFHVTFLGNILAWTLKPSQPIGEYFSVWSIEINQQPIHINTIFFCCNSMSNSFENHQKKNCEQFYFESIQYDGECKL